MNKVQNLYNIYIDIPWNIKTFAQKKIKKFKQCLEWFKLQKSNMMKEIPTDLTRNQYWDLDLYFLLCGPIKFFLCINFRTLKGIRYLQQQYAWAWERGGWRVGQNFVRYRVLIRKWFSWTPIHTEQDVPLTTEDTSYNNKSFFDQVLTSGWIVRRTSKPLDIETR